MHGQRRIIAVRAPLALRKPLKQRPKMRPPARSQPPRATTTTTKLKRPTYMKRAHDVGVAEVPHLGVRAQRKVKLAQRDCTPREAACELRDERARHLDHLGCDVLVPRRVQTGYNLSCDDRVSFYDRDG